MPNFVDDIQLTSFTSNSKKSSETLTQQTFTCSKSTTETFEKGVKYAKKIFMWKKTFFSSNDLNN